MIYQECVYVKIRKMYIKYCDMMNDGNLETNELCRVQPYHQCFLYIPFFNIPAIIFVCTFQTKTHIKRNKSFDFLVLRYITRD